MTPKIDVSTLLDHHNGMSDDQREEAEKQLLTKREYLDMTTVA